MPPVGFEPTISAGNRRPQTYSLDRAAIGTSGYIYGSRDALSNGHGYFLLAVNRLEFEANVLSRFFQKYTVKRQA